MVRYFKNIWESVTSSLTGLGITFGHMLRIRKGNVTLQYPVERWPQPDRDIGYDHDRYNLIRSRLHVDMDDCIGCYQCERACPVDCIKINTLKVEKDADIGTTSNDTKKRLLVTRFDIDMSECCYCNLCVYPCPEDCIYMTGGPNSHKQPLDYEFSTYDRNDLIFRFANVSQEEIDRVAVKPKPKPEPTEEAAK